MAENEPCFNKPRYHGVSPALDDAYRLIEAAGVFYGGQLVGTAASVDPKAPAENYADCFVRDFFPVGLILLLENRADVVRSFLHLIMQLRGQQEELEGQQIAPGVMPASFRVQRNDHGEEEVLADFGDRAIGRVAPVDSMMWWSMLLHAYVLYTGDLDFARSPEIQRMLRMILSLCLQSRFEVFPTLLVPDASFMIDRRMGVNGHPIEIQALFNATLRCASLLLPEQGSQWLVDLAQRRRNVLRSYVQQYYWLDMDVLNRIYRFETEMLGVDIENLFNIHPESIPLWVQDWLPDGAGFFVGNLGPGRMDFRFFAQGNLLMLATGMATVAQAQALTSLIEQRWNDLLGRVPMKLVYPAVEGDEWRLITGSDPKNIPWSYHNGGNWPVMIWPLVAATIKAGRMDLAERAWQMVEPRLFADRWPEYYDGRLGRLVGRRANIGQVWSAAGLLLARYFLDEPGLLERLGFDETLDETTESAEE
ncbi:alkaline invertase [Acidithiobacillus thiooxidans]|uniref:glycoside hydrolase 100 family protein n=1 Tax=Acidithiobacillus TaxID=119977 RepID=UPI00187A4961|nr:MULTISPECIES: glycoside hydrolase 100 family protein [Acidithiobacillus]MBE7566464.1 glycoside hydrolase 100 family protein [Acidithiobacillus sp. HP-11]MBU2751675.1 alkaline invertase [Acidithiobacillus thiooxidans]MBU2793447.1 alkaline invertase [Acidithiobacillus thiooxidans]MBU2836597.1 alkaline invertase [Acidithiobacillus thiooxidans]